MRETMNLIGGELKAAASGETMELVDPTTGKVAGTAPLSGEQDVDEACRAAAAAFPGWRDATPATRSLALVGDPAQPEVVVGPLIDRANHERVLEWIEEARQGGARVLCGGEPQGPCVTPTIITDADPAAKVCAEEVFGPVVVVERVRDWQAAIERTNDSRFGLQAGVFTNDLRAVWQCFEGIAVGGVIHNDFPTFRVDHMSYGGVKDSGFGREGPRYAIEEMTEPRLLVLRP